MPKPSSALRSPVVAGVVSSIFTVLLLGSGPALANSVEAVAANSVNSTSIVNNSVAGVDIKNATIASADIATNGVTSADIADSTIGSIDIADGAIGSADVADNSISGTDISAINSSDIIDNTVTGADILDGTVASVDIADGSVAGTDILDGTVAGGDITNNSVASTDIADGTLAAADFGTGLITRWAKVDGGPTTTLMRGRGVTSVSRINDQVYVVSFSDTIDGCGWLATPNSNGGALPPQTTIGIEQWSTTQLGVRLIDPLTDDTGFTVAAVC